MRVLTVFLLAFFLLVCFVGMGQAYMIDGDIVRQEDAYSMIEAWPHHAWNPLDRNYTQFFRLTNKTDYNAMVGLDYKFDHNILYGHVEYYVPPVYGWLQNPSTCFTHIFDANLNVYPGQQNPNRIRCYRNVDLNNGGTPFDLNALVFDVNFNTYNLGAYTVFTDVNGIVSGDYWADGTSLFRFKWWLNDAQYYLATMFALEGHTSRLWKITFTPNPLDFRDHKWELAYYTDNANSVDCVFRGTCAYIQWLDPWWNANYTMRIPVNISGLHSDINTTYTHIITGVNMSSWPCPDTNGVAVVFNGLATPTDINAKIEGTCGVTTDGNVLFRAQTAIKTNTDLNASDTNGYWIYVSPNTIGSNAKRDYGNVYLLYDSFENLSIANLNNQGSGNNKWTGCTLYDVTSGALCYNGGQCIVGHPNGTNPICAHGPYQNAIVDRVHMYVRMMKIGPGFVYGYFGMYKFSNLGTELWRSYIRTNGSDMGIYIPGVSTYTFTQTTPESQWRSFEYDWNKTSWQARILDGNANVGQRIGATTAVLGDVNRWALNLADTSSSGHFYWDDLIVYQTLPNEPTYALLTPEVMGFDINIENPKANETIGSSYTIDFNVSNMTYNAVDVLFDLNLNRTDGNQIILNDANVASTPGFRCDSNTLTTRTQCHYTINTTLYGNNDYNLVVFGVDPLPLTGIDTIKIIIFNFSAVPGVLPRYIAPDDFRSIDTNRFYSKDDQRLVDQNAFKSQPFNWVAWLLKFLPWPAKQTLN